MKIYIADTNIFRHWWDEYYFPQFFPSVKQKFEELIIQKRFFVPTAVIEEIDDICSLPVGKWVRANPKMLLSNNNLVQQKLKEVLTQFPKLVDEERPDRDADVWVIAHALVMQGTVFTLETPVSTKPRPRQPYYMPDACNHYKVPYFDFFQFMQEEKWFI